MLDRQDDVVSSRILVLNVLYLLRISLHFKLAVGAWYENYSLILCCFLQHGNAALHEAAWNGFSATLEILIKNKANVHLLNKQGFSALHLAAQNGHNQSARLLLFAGCDSNLQNKVSDGGSNGCLYDVLVKLSSISLRLSVTVVYCLAYN